MAVLSRLPSPLSRAIRLRVVPFTVVNWPPSTIFPSACTATLVTSLFAPVPGLKVAVLSRLPSPLSRAIPLRAAPFTVVKRPPSTSFPSACTATQLTSPFVLAVKVASTLPSALSRAIFACAAPPTVVKLPPMIVVPSGCTAVAVT